jgi:hypothetical protein
MPPKAGRTNASDKGAVPAPSPPNPNEDINIDDAVENATTIIIEEIISELCGHDDVINIYRQLYEVPFATRRYRN